MRGLPWGFPIATVFFVWNMYYAIGGAWYSWVGAGISLALMLECVYLWVRELKISAESVPAFDVKLAPSAQAELARAPEEVREAVLKMMDTMKQNPFMGEPMTRNPIVHLEKYMLRYFRKRYLARRPINLVPVPPVEHEFVPLSSFSPPAGEDERVS